MSEQVKAIATAWMKHQGYTDAEIAAGESEMDHSLCEMVPGVGWDCMDEDGYHRHPEVGALAEAAEMANVALEALAAGQVEPRTITQVEQLETLPEGTFLRIAGWVYLLHEGKWYLINTRDMTLGTQSVLGGRIGLNHIGLRHHLPATVLTAQPAISAEQVEEAAMVARASWPLHDGYLAWAELEEATRAAWRSVAVATFKAVGLTVAGESDG